jgi:predicted aldo/keto reductase-like oxidoreductase
MALALSSWWLGDFGSLVREELRNDPEDLVQLALRAKSISLEVLSQSYSDRDFFGNLLPKILKVCSKLTFLRRQQKSARRTIRHRGYRDHGTLRPESSWFETSDWTFVEQQNLIEETRAVREDTLAFLEGLLQG